MPTERGRNAQRRPDRYIHLPCEPTRRGCWDAPMHRNVPWPWAWLPMQRDWAAIPNYSCSSLLGRSGSATLKSIRAF